MPSAQGWSCRHIKLGDGRAIDGNRGFLAGEPESHSSFPHTRACSAGFPRASTSPLLQLTSRLDEQLRVQVDQWAAATLGVRNGVGAGGLEGVGGAYHARLDHPGATLRYAHRGCL